LTPIGLALSCALGACAGAKASTPERAAAPVVLLELFSSEGCSSCPPAERFLRKVDRDDKRVIALEYHVDYWDDLGWKDPFSIPEASQRQRGYARALGGGVFTPELVVQGKHVVQGSARESVADWLERAATNATSTIALTGNGDQLSLHASGLPKLAAGDVADVFVVVSESGLSSRVKSGENAGQTLEHAPVVRSITRVGEATGSELDWKGEIRLDPSWNSNALRYVAFVQHRNGREIVAAAVKK
jgi:hypothetical protein